MLFKKNLLPSYLALIAISVFYSCNKDEGPAEPDPTGFLGEIDFVRTYGGSGEDDATSMVIANDGNYVLLGYTDSNDGDITDKTGTDFDYWVTKITPAGELLWSKTYGGSDDDKGANISKTSDGGYLLSGYSSSADGDVSNNAGFQDYWIVKIDSQGTLMWDKSYGFSGVDQSFDAFQTNDGGYFITGFLDVTASGGQGNDDGRNPQHGVGEFWGIRLDANGNTIWRRYFGGTNNDRSYGAVQTADGGFLMTGSSESDDFDITDSKGSYDFWAVRLNSAGDKLWTKSFGGSEIDIGYAMSHSNDGNYIMVGDTRSSDGDVTNPLGNADAWAVKFNDAGTLIWQKTYGGSQFESARSIVPISNGRYVVAASTRSTNGDLTANVGLNDAWTFIINEQGGIDFQMSVGGSKLDFANKAMETPDGKLVVIGNSESSDVDIPQNRGKIDLLFIQIK
ncbi:hypothetical protein [Altibacter sp.]|uniref:hypothetical protein n=1 Tax=Altibacter sp. TaxID=2024823 RepID=UPI00258EF108|nr:hypothetical protein [Altibacter sp.]MCW9037231.1 hypothetical protein [Altibacter sp.]